MRRDDAVVLVGGLGSPYDRLLSAVLRVEGMPAQPLGVLDADALERGREALPRGQCAPLLYTTGALLRAAGEHRGPLTYLGVDSCGPCRFVLFPDSWQRALIASGRRHADVYAFHQSSEAVSALFGERAVLRTVEALAVGDVVAEAQRRLLPHVESVPDLLKRVEEAEERIAQRIENGATPLSALEEERPVFVSAPLRDPRPLARIVLTGEPWSAHVAGDAQLNLPAVLAVAGCEVEAPPVSLWLDYLMWQVEQPTFGDRPDPTPVQLARAQFLRTYMRDRLAMASRAIGMRRMVMPDQEALAKLAEPYLPSAFRGGYGHIEIALAVRAKQERRAHAVIGVKSFGCIPSAGVSDGILPTVLEGALPYLSLEVCGDGEAARESRLMMRVAAAIEAAEAELADACRACGVSREEALQNARRNPLDDGLVLKRRPYACTLACQVRAQPRASSPRPGPAA